MCRCRPRPCRSATRPATNPPRWSPRPASTAGTARHGRLTRATPGPISAPQDRGAPERLHAVDRHQRRHRHRHRHRHREAHHGPRPRIHNHHPGLPRPATPAAAAPANPARPAATHPNPQPRADPAHPGHAARTSAAGGDHLAGGLRFPRGCISRPSQLHLEGIRIDSIRVSLDTQQVRQATLQILQQRALLLPRLPRPGSHHVSVHITFQPGSGRPPLTLTHTITIYHRPPPRTPRRTGIGPGMSLATNANSSALIWLTEVNGSSYRKLLAGLANRVALDTRCNSQSAASPAAPVVNTVALLRVARCHPLVQSSLSRQQVLPLRTGRHLRAD